MTDRAVRADHVRHQALLRIRARRNRALRLALIANLIRRKNR
ncbi:hypothetical protein [Micromonospora aurantiaca (nom. illeg.)]